MLTHTKNILLIIVTLALLIRCDRNKTPFSVEVTGYPRQLTFAGLVHKGILSPDGSSIAFIRAAPNWYKNLGAAVPFELWMMNPFGRYPYCLVSIIEPEMSDHYILVRDFCWFPDSRSLLVEILQIVPRPDRDHTEIWRIYLNGDKIRLTSPDENINDSSLSPDGTRIAFKIQDTLSLAYLLCTADIDGTQRTLIDSGGFLGYTWTNDSRGFIYALRDTERWNYDLWYASADGNDKYRLSGSDVNERNPECSSDGRFVAFNSDENTVYYSPIDNYDPQLLLKNANVEKWVPYTNCILAHLKLSKEWWIVDLGGNGIKKINGEFIAQVNFSADGRHYVYTDLFSLWLDCFP